MTTLYIEMDRGNGWELRVDGEAHTTLDAVRQTLPAYAIQYPHRAMVDGGHLIVAPGKGMTKAQIAECHAHAGNMGATIEFLK